MAINVSGLEDFVIEVEGEGATVGDAYTDLVQKVCKEVWTEYEDKWLPTGHYINRDWIDGEPSTPGLPAGWGFTERLLEGIIPQELFDEAFISGQQIGDSEPKGGHVGNETGSGGWTMEYEFTVIPDKWVNVILVHLLGGDGEIENLIAHDPTTAAATTAIQEATKTQASEADLTDPVDEDVQDDRPVTEAEIPGLPENVKAIIAKASADANTVKETYKDEDQPSTDSDAPGGASAPPKTTVRLNPDNYEEGTHIVYRDPNIYIGPRVDATKLRSNPSRKKGKKPWVSLKNKTLVKVTKQNIGKRGAFHEVEVKSGEFSSVWFDGAAANKWPLTTEVNKGYIATKFLRPLGEGILAPVKEVASNTDLRLGQSDKVPTDWRKRKPDVPLLITNHESPWDSTYEIVLRTKEKNFGSLDEESFLKKYAMVGALAILRYYNKDFKETAPSEEKMAELLVETGLCEKIEWHLDSTTKNSKILVNVVIFAKKIDHYPKKLENFDFDKVREGDDPRVSSAGIDGTQEQIDAVSAGLSVNLPSVSVPGIEKITDLVPAYSLACKYGDLKSNLETLKEILQYYKDLMNKDKENRIATFPHGPVRGPLKFDKEIKNLDTWLGAVRNFLANNEYDYHGEPCAQGQTASTPKNAADEDILEFGWNSGYQLVYVLFNGFPLKIGIKYFAERSGFKFRRTNHFIHNSFDVEGDNTAKQIAAQGGEGQLLEIVGTDEGTFKEVGPTTTYSNAEDNTAPSDEVSILKRGTISEYKDPPDKRKPWTEWILTHVYKDGIIRPSESKEETPNKTLTETKEQEYGEGPYTEEEATNQEEKDKNVEDKVKANQEAEKTTFETMDSFVKDAEAIVNQIEELEQTFHFFINKVGLGPLLDALMACLMKQIPSVEEMLAKIGLEAIFKDTKKAIQLIGDILDSAPMECTLAVLNAALELVYEEHPQQEIPGISDFEQATEKVAEEALVAGTTDDQPLTDDNAEPIEEPDIDVKENHRIVAIRKSSLKGLFPSKEELKTHWSIDYKFKNDSSIVKKWQEVLVTESKYADAGFTNDQTQVDGIYGPKTEAATNLLLACSPGTCVADPYPAAIGEDGYDTGGGHKWVVKETYDFWMAEMALLAPATAADTDDSTEGADGSEASAPGSDLKAVIMTKGSKDKRKGLKNHVTIWQKFLVAEGFILLTEDSENYVTGPRRWTGTDASQADDSHNMVPGPAATDTDNDVLNNGRLGIKEVKSGKYRYYYEKDGEDKNTKFGIDGIFGWRTEAATINWLTWATYIAGAAAPWDGADSAAGQVTQGMYNMAKAFLEHKSQSKEASSEIDGMAGVDIANRVKFLGPRPPAGYYCRIGEPGPCDEIYSEVVKISRKIAIAEMSPTPTDLGDLLKKQSDLKIEYVNCMKSAEDEPVIGEGIDHFAGKEQTENDQEKELATAIVVAEGTCDPKREALINKLLEYDPTKPTTWPGTDAIDILKNTNEELALGIEKALQEYLECTNKEITDKRQKLVESGGVALASVTQIHPFPKSIKEAWMQFRKAGRFPTNVQIKEGFEGGDLWDVIYMTDACQELIDSLIDYLLQHVPPPTRTVLERLIQAALSGNFAGLLPAGPDVPAVPDTSTLSNMVKDTYDPEGLLRQMLEDMLMKILTEIITGLVKILVEMVDEACADNEAAAEDFGGLSASDIFAGAGDESINIPDFEDLQNRLNKLQDAINDWGLPFDVQPGGSSSPGESISYWDVLDELSKILKPSQLCALFNGEASVIILAAVREFLDERFPEVSALFPTQDMLVEFLMLLGKYADPKLCQEVKEGKYARALDTAGAKVCIPDLVRDRKLAACIDAGLTQEQCEDMIDRREDDDIANMVKLANWPPEMPDMCLELAEMKTNLPSVQAALRDILKGLVDQAVMIFNGETGYFIPALIHAGNLFDLDSLPDAIKDIDLLTDDADQTSAAVASLCLGIAEALVDKSPEEMGDMAAAMNSDFNKQSKSTGKALNDDDFYDSDSGFTEANAKEAADAAMDIDKLKEQLGVGIEQYVANRLRNHLRTRATFSTSTENSKTRFKVPKTSKNSLTYTLPDGDYLIDSFNVKVSEDDNNMYFENSKFINELVEVYVKEQMPEWPPQPGETGPFTGDTPPQLDLMKHILEQKLLESAPESGPGTGNLITTIDNISNSAHKETYHAIKDDLIYRVRREISHSILFKKKELEKLVLTPSTEEAKDECGIPLMLHGDIEVGSLLKPKKYLEAAIKSYNDAVADECEDGPPGPDEEGPLQKAVTELVVRMLLRTYAVEMSLNSIFVLTKFRAKDSMYDKIMLGYTLNAFKQDMLGRRIYGRTKKVAQRIIRKRRKEGVDPVPTNLRSGYECLKFLLREELKDVNLEFEKIINGHPKLNVNDMPEWEKDGFAPHIILGGPEENFGIFPWNQAMHIQMDGTWAHLEPSLPMGYQPLNGARFWLPKDPESTSYKVPNFWIDPFGSIGGGLAQYPDAPPPTPPTTFGLGSASPKHKEYKNKGRRLNTEINPKSLGYDTLDHAKKYYDLGPERDKIVLTDVLKKHGVFIWEPYLKVDENTYLEDNNPPAESLGQDPIKEPHNELLKRLIGIDYVDVFASDAVAGAESGAGGPHANIDNMNLQKLESEDFKWNYGLTGYVDILEYAEYIDRIGIHLEDFITKTETHLNYSAEAPTITQTYEIADAATTGGDDTPGAINAFSTYQDWMLLGSSNEMHDQGSWPEDDPTIGMPFMYNLLKTTDWAQNQSDKLYREDFIKWWSYYIGQEAANQAWKELNSTIQSITTADTPTHHEPEGSVGGHEFDDILLRAEGIPAAGPPGLMDIVKGYDWIRPGRLINSLERIVNGSPYYEVGGSGWGNPYTLPYPVYPRHKLVFIPGDNPPESNHYIESGLSSDHYEELQARFANLGPQGDFKLVIISNDHEAHPSQWNDKPDAFNPDWPFSGGGASDIYNTLRISTTWGYLKPGWFPATRTLVSQIYKFIGLMGSDADSTRLATNGILNNSPVTEAKALYAETRKLATTPIGNLIGGVADDNYIKSMKWGLRLTYVFGEGNIPDHLKDILTDIQGGYVAVGNNAPNPETVPYIRYRNNADVNSPSYNGWPESGPGLSESTLSLTKGQDVDGAPKLTVVEFASFLDKDGANVAMETGSKKVYSITLMEAQKDFTDTSIANLPIGRYNVPTGDVLWPGRWHQTFYQEAFEELKQEIVSSEKYAAIFDYTFPFRRYLALNTINVIQAMKKIGPGPLMYIGTRDILTSILLGAQDGTGPDSYDYKDPQLASLGDTAGMFSDSFNSENFKPKKINIAAMVLKLFLETPFKILKGLVEAFDPNISIIKKIMDILKIIIESLPEIAPECIIQQAVAAAQAALGTGVSLPEGAADQIKADLDAKYAEIKLKLKQILDDLPVPLISILMLPSMLPYGCGFPPPPFGWGIGPPLTPFGVAYLILGLYKDTKLMSPPDMGKRDTPGGILDKMDMDLEALCKEKVEKYQEIAALGLIDSEPDEEDTD